jgi:regulator of replication initiation timing
MLMKTLSRASQDADSARKELQSVTLKAWDDQVRAHEKELAEERAKVKELAEENARLKHPEHELLPGDLSTPENYTQEREQPESLPKLVEYLNSLWRKYDSRQKVQSGAYSKGYWRGRADGTAWSAGCVASLIRHNLDQAASGPKGSAVDFVARHALHQLSCELHRRGLPDLAAVIRVALDKPST